MLLGHEVLCYSWISLNFVFSTSYSWIIQRPLALVWITAPCRPQPLLCRRRSIAYHNLLFVDQFNLSLSLFQDFTALTYLDSLAASGMDSSSRTFVFPLGYDRWWRYDPHHHHH